MEKIKVDIAMACYNSAKFIETAIKSIIEQTYENWQLNICDDCSTDKSCKIIENFIDKYKDKIKILKHKKNYGYGRTLRDAIAIGNGELVAIIDSDDALADKNAFKIMVKKHIEHPEASLVYSNYYRCNSDLVPTKRSSSRQLKIGESYLYNKIRISHLKVFKRSYYDKTEGVNGKLLKTVDKDLVLKLEEVGRLIYVNKLLYFYRKHKRSLSLSLNKKICASMRKSVYKNVRDRRGLNKKGLIKK